MAEWFSPSAHRAIKKMMYKWNENRSEGRLSLTADFVMGRWPKSSLTPEQYR